MLYKIVLSFFLDCKIPLAYDMYKGALKTWLYHPLIEAWAIV